jgi:hypothetical protein
MDSLTEKEVDSEGQKGGPLDATKIDAHGVDLTVADMIDHAAEARVIRKLDMWIVPPVMLLYLFRFVRCPPYGDLHASSYDLPSPITQRSRTDLIVNIVFSTG